MVDLNELNNFIIKVFNYYNGKINIINKAVLDINWANLINTNDAGYSKPPNLIIINPMVIVRFCNGDEVSIKTNIIETIIHELYHTDQLINYKLYLSDNNYRVFIENACEIQTAIYISGHLKEISELLQMNIAFSNKAGFYKRMQYYDLPGIKYQRRYYHDHIFLCIHEICNFDKDIAEIIYDYIKNNVENRDNIIININNEVVNVCINNNLLPIEEFNKVFIKYICNGFYNTTHYATYSNNNELIIIINIEVLNTMCKKV